MADAAYGSWDPLNLIFLFFSRENLPWAFSWHLALHQPFLYTGIVLALGALGVAGGHRGWLALLFCCSAFVLGLVQTFSVYTVLVPLPFLIWSWLTWLKRREIKYVWWSALFLGGAFLMASPEFVLIYALIIALLCGRALLCNIWTLVLTGLGAAMVAGPQLFPFVPLLAESRRAPASAALRDSAFQSFHPIRILEIFFPQIFGNFVPENNFWGAHFTNGPFSMPLIVSFGVGSSALYFGMLFLKRNRAGVSRRLALIGLSLFILGCGAYLPWHAYSWLQTILPPLGWLRYPEKFSACGLFLILLSASTKAPLLIRTLQRLPKTQLRARDFLAGIGVILVAMSFLFLEISIQRALLAPGLLALSLTGLIEVKRRQLLPAKSFSYYFVLLLFVETLWGARHYLWDQPKNLVFEQPQLVELQKSMPGPLENAPFRVLTTATDRDLAALLALAPPELDIVGKAAWAETRLMYPSIPLLWGIYNASNYSGIFPAWRQAWWREQAARNTQELLELMSVAYKLGSDGMKPNPTAMPYIKVDGSVQILQRSFNRLVIKVQGLSGEHELIRNEAFSTNWHATLATGQELPLIKANGWAQGLTVPAGASEVEIYFSYNEPLLYWGLASLGAFLLIGLCLINTACINSAQPKPAQMPPKTSLG